MKKFPAFSLSGVVFIMLIKVKRQQLLAYKTILTFKSRVEFVLSWGEHGKSFITLGPYWAAKKPFETQ